MGRQYRGTGFYSGFALVVLVAVGLIILAAQNTETVTLEFLGASLNTPLVALLVGAILVGALLGEVVGWVWRRRRRRMLAEREELAARRAGVQMPAAAESGEAGLREA